MTLIEAEHRFAGEKGLVENLDTSLNVLDEPENPGLRVHLPTELFYGSITMGREEVKWRLDVPKSLKYEGIAVLNNGHSVTDLISRTPQNALAQEGFAALSYSPPRELDRSWWTTVTDPHQRHAEAQRLIIDSLKNRLEIRKYPNNDKKLDLERVLSIAHSMGVYAATSFAEMEPDMVEAIYGQATCGFGHPNIPELAVDIPKGIASAIRYDLFPVIKSGNIAVDLRIVKELFNYYRHLRIIFESTSCVVNDIRSVVNDLQQAGIPFHYEAYEYDILVRADKSVAKYVTSHQIIPNAGHMYPFKKPKVAAQRIGSLFAA